MPDQHPTQSGGRTIHRWPLRRIRVRGPSMVPTLAPGDRLVVLRWSRWGEGSVVAVVDPTAPGRLLVKRVERIAPEGVHVLGDNRGASTDSRTWGPVPRSSVIGRVVYRYAPPSAVGPVS